jgi:hypothetical protein
MAPFTHQSGGTCRRQRRREPRCRSACGSKEQAVRSTVWLGGTTSSIASRTSSSSRRSAPTSWESSCARVRGPMMVEVTAGVCLGERQAEADRVRLGVRGDLLQGRQRSQLVRGPLHAEAPAPHVQPLELRALGSDLGRAVLAREPTAVERASHDDAHAPGDDRYLLLQRRPLRETVRHPRATLLVRRRRGGRRGGRRPIDHHRAPARRDTAPSDRRRGAHPRGSPRRSTPSTRRVRG